MEYYRRDGRHDLPWRKTRDPYCILVSEIMLQQTQVGRVGGFYGNFIKRFSGFEALARAKNGDVLRVWQGMGYNRRAISLKKLAEIVVRDCGGKLPSDRAALETLPGIGKGTSGSLMAFVWNKPEVFIETNIRRAFIHFFFPRRKKVTDAEIERYLKRTLLTKVPGGPRIWYWALMDYGAMLGRASAGREGANANLRSAHYKKQARFAGSDRELRGKILRLVLSRGTISRAALSVVFNGLEKRTGSIIDSLAKEGFIAIKGQQLCIKN